MIGALSVQTTGRLPELVEQKWPDCVLISLRAWARGLGRERKVQSPGWAQVRGWPAECTCPPLQHQRDCGRRTTSTGGNCLVTYTLRLILEPLRTLRSGDKRQAGACPDRARAIPCTVRAVTGSFQGQEIAGRVGPQTRGYEPSLVAAPIHDPEEMRNDLDHMRREQLNTSR